jgi:hypothetical protein
VVVDAEAVMLQQAYQAQVAEEVVLVIIILTANRAATALLLLDGPKQTEIEQQLKELYK